MDDVPTDHHPTLVHREISLTAIGILRLKGYPLMLALPMRTRDEVAVGCKITLAGLVALNASRLRVSRVAPSSCPIIDSQVHLPTPPIAPSALHHAFHSSRKEDPQLCSESCLR